ncbi:hypothetical protein HHI36_002168 [Cryptolaemus montrouzieri]|uniref:Amine oxidase domain-containing protein n=1 Tax=Cryptolaemus montrouzieri TaxID=559131 RepID=A0ABD2P9Q3_9CUCU
MKLLLCCILLCLELLAKAEKIIIVGAGASGIAAATRLIENNITDFIFLEAEKRLGGRIHSIYLLDGNSGGHVDLGGEYVGGEEGNVVFNLSKNELKHGDLGKRTTTFYSDGKLIDVELSKEILLFKEHLRDEFEGKQPISAADAFLERYNSTILSKYKENPEYLQKATDFIETCENIFRFRHGAFDWSKILLNDHYRICKGDQNLNWNGKGYRHFLDLLMRKFGDEHRLRLYPIFYSETVMKIMWNKAGKVEIFTERDKKYEADHVIFTPSVGVLKENHEKLFEPNLPANKVNAIKEIGFDSAMKVILQFNEKWWDDEVLDFIFVWNKEDEAKISKEYQFGPKKEGKSWLSTFHRMFTAPGMSKVLIGWFTGPLVPEIEKLKIEEIKNGVHYVIKKFLGKKYNVTEPYIVIPSTWYTNPNFRGVYSYETVESANRTKQIQEDLGEPLLNKDGIPVVLFAGEHTHKTHFSSVHGAVESGYNAADELVKYLNEK